MTKFFAQLSSRTQKIVKPLGVTQVDHFSHVFRNYVNLKGDKTDRHPGTISRWMSGKTLPPWDLVADYAGCGTRCPKSLVEDLNDYISAYYNTQPLRDALRAAIMEVLSLLPEEDQTDIRGYWEESNLGNMWAVMTWYCVTNDYASATWSA